MGPRDTLQRGGTGLGTQSGDVVGRQPRGAGRPGSAGRPNGTRHQRQDVAGAIVAFASGLMSFCTGQVVVCNGGRMLTNPINTGAPG